MSLNLYKHRNTNEGQHRSLAAQGPWIENGRIGSTNNQPLGAKIMGTVDAWGVQESRSIKDDARIASADG